ncbi:MAG: DUF1801 domain-containing protein [Phycisphaerae bacterium]|jgi:hypothetical protein
MPERSGRRSAKRPSKVVARKGVGDRADAPAETEGDTRVRAYIAALPPWQREIARSFDALMAKEVPGVRRAIKWGLPFYGVKNQGWIVSCGAFDQTVKITFFQGLALKPVPPSGAGRQLRGVDLRSPEEFDGKQLASWIRQAAKLPGMGS